MVAHSADLITLALKLSDIPHSSKAFQLLCVANEEVFHALVEQDILSDVTTRVFSESPPSVVVNRLAVISSAVYLAVPDLAVQKKVSLTGFFGYLSQSSVFDMFIAFLQNTDQGRLFQEGLRADGFADRVLSEIGKLTGESNPEDAAAFFKMVAAVAAAESLSGLVKTGPALCGILRELGGADASVLNAQYAAVEAVVCDENIDVIVEHLPALVGKIDPERPMVSAYEITIIKLMTRVLAAEEGPSAIARSDLAVRLAAVLRKFRRHSIVHVAISSFVIGLLDFPAISRPFFDAVIPIAGEALSGRMVEERGFGWNFLGELRKRDEAFAGRAVTPAVWESFRALQTIAENRFGGAPSSPVLGLGNDRGMMINISTNEVCVDCMHSCKGRLGCSSIHANTVVGDGRVFSDCNAPQQVLS
jgi:hypothetical protein